MPDPTCPLSRDDVMGERSDLIPGHYGPNTGAERNVVGERVIREVARNQAIAECRRLIQRKPDFVEGHVSLGVALAESENSMKRSGRFNRLSRCSRATPQPARTWPLQCNCRRNVGEWEPVCADSISPAAQLRYIKHVCQPRGRRWLIVSVFGNPVAVVFAN